ncbi:hypothetical protein YQE_03898, partial [Dendroctonus ponderosae]
MARGWLLLGQVSFSFFATSPITFVIFNLSNEKGTLMTWDTKLYSYYRRLDELPQMQRGWSAAEKKNV